MGFLVSLGSLEIESERKLDSARSLRVLFAANSGHLAKQRTGRVGDDAAEIVTVEGVQHIGAELDAVLLADVEVLLRRDVFADDANVSRARQGIGAVAERQRRGSEKALLFKYAFAVDPRLARSKADFWNEALRRSPDNTSARFTAPFQ